MQDVERMVSQIGMGGNELLEGAGGLLKKVIKDGLVRGRTLDSVVTSVLYTAYRIYDFPVTWEDMYAHSKIVSGEVVKSEKDRSRKRKAIGRTYRRIHRTLEIDIHAVKPYELIPRFGSDLNLSQAVQNKAIKILKDSENRGLSGGKSPTGLSAAAIYVAAVMGGERRTQKQVSAVANVTEVTVRNRYKELVKKLELEIPI
jgi:transcription initiation factor TFIIB